MSSQIFLYSQSIINKTKNYTHIIIFHLFVNYVTELFFSPAGTNACKYLKKTSDTMYNTNVNKFSLTMAGLDNPIVIPLQDKVPVSKTRKLSIKNMSVFYTKCFSASKTSIIIMASNTCWYSKPVFFGFL